MKEKFRILDWDSSFFEFKVGQVDNDQSLTPDFLKHLDNNQLQLCYYLSNKKLSKDSLVNDYYKIERILTRIPIVKRIGNWTEIHEKITSYRARTPTAELYDLARLSGSLGRFAQDPNIPEYKYHDLFNNWIENSVKRKIADEVLVYKEKGKIIGFVTLKWDGENGYGPLLAVNREFEGKGVAFALMRAIETKLLENNCKYFISGTQKDNRKALTIFKRFGFELQSAEYVYHLWRKK